MSLRFEHGDRVRLIVASCLTVAALPFLLREGKEQRDDRPPTVAAVAPAGEALASGIDQSVSTTVAPDDTAPPATSAATTDPPSFLSGPTTPTATSAIVVAVPTAASADTQTGTASYRRWTPGATSAAAPCAAWFLDVGTTVVVTNLDNGHAVECVVTQRTGVPDDQMIVLDTPVFEQLADLIEAPIPVTITWS